MAVILHPCPTCGVGENEACVRPNGKNRLNPHDTRPFSIETESLVFIDEMPIELNRIAQEILDGN